MRASVSMHCMVITERYPTVRAFRIEGRHVSQLRGYTYGSHFHILTLPQAVARDLSSYSRGAPYLKPSPQLFSRSRQAAYHTRPSLSFSTGRARFVCEVRSSLQVGIVRLAAISCFLFPMFLIDSVTPEDSKVRHRQLLRPAQL
jgi:hypothetical protein